MNSLQGILNIVVLIATSLSILTTFVSFKRQREMRSQLPMKKIVAVEEKLQRMSFVVYQSLRINSGLDTTFNDRALMHIMAETFPDLE